MQQREWSRIPFTTAAQCLHLNLFHSTESEFP